MPTLAIFGNTAQPRHRIGAIATFLAMLQRTDNAAVTVEKRFMFYLRALDDAIPLFPTFEQLPLDTDMAISMGGDGTFLTTARVIGRLGIPIVGVNTGHLGFLADVDVADGRRLIDALMRGQYRVEQRTVLTASILSGPGVISPDAFALNEIAILRHESASMIEVKTALDGAALADFRGDGLIVSTPTGSTGYNLSVGGPIIAPTTPALSIAPIAPHSLTMRPLVVADSTVVDIAIASRTTSWRLSLDGRWITLPIETRVRIHRADFTIPIVHTEGHTFASTLRSKLLWGAATF